MSSAAQEQKTQGPKPWREILPGTVTLAASAREVETGLWRSMRPVLDEAKCVSCLRCWLQCPDDSVRAEGDAVAFDLFFCKGCGLCARLCPTKAISMRPEADFTSAPQPGEHGKNPGKAGDLIGS